MLKLLSNKKFRLFLILILVSFISILWIYIKFKGSPQTLPTPVPRVFNLDRAIPPNGIDTTIVPTSAIEFDFNKQINPNTLIVTVIPQSNLKFEVGENRRSVFVRVAPTWELNTNYTITIDVKSQEGESLPNKIEYPLRIIRQTKSDLIEKFQ